MSYSEEELEGRALAYVGSLVFSAGLAAFASIAFFCREMLRTARERRAENWQAGSAQITRGTVTAIHGRFIDYAIANVGYSYSLEGNYYSGYLTRQFWDEQAAWTFADGSTGHRPKHVWIMREPRISDVDDRPHWVHYSYSINGCSYSSSHYFRAFGEEDAKEQIEPWRGAEDHHSLFPRKSCPFSFHRK